MSRPVAHTRDSYGTCYVIVSEEQLEAAWCSSKPSAQQHSRSSKPREGFVDQHNLEPLLGKKPCVEESTVAIHKAIPTTIHAKTSPRWLPVTTKNDILGAQVSSNHQPKASSTLCKLEYNDTWSKPNLNRMPNSGICSAILFQVNTLSKNLASRITTSYRINLSDEAGRSKRKVEIRPQSETATSIVKERLSKLAHNKVRCSDTPNRELIIRSYASDSLDTEKGETAESRLSQQLNAPDQPQCCRIKSDVRPQEEKLPSVATNIHHWVGLQSQQVIASPASMPKHHRTVQNALTLAKSAFPLQEARLNITARHQDQSNSCPSFLMHGPSSSNQRPPKSHVRSGLGTQDKTTYAATNPIHDKKSNPGRPPRKRRQGDDPPEEQSFSGNRRGRKKRLASKYHCVYLGAPGGDSTENCGTKHSYVSQLRRHHERHEFYYCTICFQRFASSSDRNAHDQTTDCSFKCVSEDCPYKGQFFNPTSTQCGHGKRNSQRYQWKELFRLARPGEPVPDPGDSGQVDQQPLPPFPPLPTTPVRQMPTPVCASIAESEIVRQELPRSITSIQHRSSFGLAAVAAKLSSLANRVVQYGDAINSSDMASIEAIRQYTRLGLEQLQQVVKHVARARTHDPAYNQSTDDYGMADRPRSDARISVDPTSNEPSDGSGLSSEPPRQPVLGQTDQPMYLPPAGFLAPEREEMPPPPPPLSGYPSAPYPVDNEADWARFASQGPNSSYDGWQ